MRVNPADLGLGPAARLLVDVDQSRATHVAFPSRPRTRMLVPRGPASAAAESVRHYTVPDSWRRRAMLGVSSALARLGAARVVGAGVALGGAGTFIEHLHQALDRDDVVLAIHLGPPRANRKPVLRIMDRRGRTLAFAKIGINELTNARVRHEAEALELLESHATAPMRTPALIEHGTWSGFEYLLMGPVGEGSARTASRELRGGGTAALRSAFPESVHPLVASGIWERTMSTLSDVGTAESAHLLRIAHDIESHAGSMQFAFGAGHGDWSRWNMSGDGVNLFVWDWERLALDVPAGWDDLHYVIGIHPRGVAGALADPGALLESVYGALPTRRAAVLMAAYLLQRAAAYLSDRQLEAGARTGALGAWLLPALEHVATIVSGSTRNTCREDQQ